MSEAKMINIEGLDRAEVFAALFNNAKPQGLGLLHYQQRTMKADEAFMVLSTNSSGYIDYYEGRVLKVSLPPNAKEFDARLYDRDNGSGAASAAVDAVRARAEGRCCGVFVPEWFLGAKREKLNFVGIPGWCFRVLGGELSITPVRCWEALGLRAEFDFALLNRQAKVIVRIEDGSTRGQGVRNYDEFVRYATMVIYKCINELASNQNCPKTYWQVQPHFVEDNISIVDDFVSRGISHDNG